MVNRARMILDESFDHRTAVRASLANDSAFGEYLSQIQAWLQSQHSIVLDGILASHLIENRTGGKYMLQAFNGNSDAAKFFGGDKRVGSFSTFIGDCSNTSFSLVRSEEDFQGLAEVKKDFAAQYPGLNNACGASLLLTPAPFSPAQ